MLYLTLPFIVQASPGAKQLKLLGEVNGEARRGPPLPPPSLPLSLPLRCWRGGCFRSYINCLQSFQEQFQFSFWLSEQLRPKFQSNLMSLQVTSASGFSPKSRPNSLPVPVPILVPVIWWCSDPAPPPVLLMQQQQDCLFTCTYLLLHWI